MLVLLVTSILILAVKIQPVKALGPTPAFSSPLISTAQTETTVTLWWPQSDDVWFYSYTLWFSYTGVNGPYYDIWTTGDKAQNSLGVTGLVSNTNYWFYVEDKGLLVDYPSNTIQVTTTYNPWLWITSYDNTSATLAWYDYNTLPYSSFEPFVSYILQVSTSGSGGPWSTIASMNDPSQNNFRQMGLSVSTAYWFQLYDIVGQPGNTFSSYSNIVVVPPRDFSVSISPSSVAIYVDQPQLFTSSVTGGTSPFSYQWYLNDNPVSGATNPTWTFTPSSSGSYNVYLNVTDNAGSKAKSNIASVTVSTVSTSLVMMNVLDGTNNFFFTTATKNVGDTFVINVTANNAVNVGTWQVLITWDASLLSFQSFVLPSDNILAYSSPISSITPGSGSLACGATLGPGFTTGFTGSGRLGVLILKIIQGVGGPPLPSMVSCALNFTNIGTDTYLLDPSLNSLAFTPVNGHYSYSVPILAIINPVDGTNFFNLTGKAMGDTFTINITVTNVVNLDVWQVALQWNPSLLTFVSITLPSDHVFHDKSPVTAGPDLSVPGQMIYGVSEGPGQTGFTGSGVLAQVTLRIQSAGQSPISFEGVSSDTYLLATSLADIPFIPVNGTVNIGTHDVAVTNVLSSKTVIGKGYEGNVTITVQNQGNFTESFNVTNYANTVSYFLQNVTLASGNFLILTLSWDTTGFAYGNYTVSSRADVVSSEANTTNNNSTCTYPVHVGVPGDVSSSTLGVYDGVVNMRDIAYLVSLFYTHPGSPNWNPNADVNNDGVCNMKDIAIAILYFNQHE